MAIFLTKFKVKWAKMVKNGRFWGLISQLKAKGKTRIMVCVLKNSSITLYLETFLCYRKGSKKTKQKQEQSSKEPPNVRGNDNI